MPYMCFSYPSDVPAPSSPRRMTVSHFFSYSPEMLRRMPSGTCFGYSIDVPPGAGNGNAAPSAPPGLHRMTYSTCFRY